MRLVRHLLALGRRPGAVSARLVRTCAAGCSWAAPVAAAAVAAAVAGVQDSACPAAAAALPADEQDGVLSRWLRARGAKLGPISFAPAGATGNGAFVAEDVVAGTALLNLPSDVVLSAACACGTPDVGEKLTKLRERLRPSAGANSATLDALLLSVMLIELRCRPKQHHQEQSGVPSWQQWVGTLPPPDAVDIPVCWSDSQLARLTGTPVYGVASARRAWLDDLTQSLQPLLSEVGLDVAAAALGDSQQWLRWADALVWSRAVCLPAHIQGEQGEELAMLPGESM